MEILYFYGDDGTAMYTWQYHHIINELAHYNCNITVFNPRNYASMDEANEKVLEHLSKNRYDLFMSQHTTDDLYPGTLVQVKDMGMPRLLLLFDNLVMPLRHLEATKYYDAALLLNQDDCPIYKKYECKSFFSAYAANPYYLVPHYTKPINRTCFIGTPYGTRSIPINALTSNGFDVDLYAKISDAPIRGVGSTMSSKQKIDTAMEFMKYEVGRKILIAAIKSGVIKQAPLNVDSEYLHTFPPVDLKTMNALFSNYALSISYSPCRSTGLLKNPVHIVRLRNFEIPMCGGLQICMYYPELAEYFEEDKEIVFYRSDDEFVDKARFYADPKHHAACMAIKKAARKRAEAEHTWYKRFSPVFDHMGLTNK